MGHPTHPFLSAGVRRCLSKDVGDSGAPASAQCSASQSPCHASIYLQREVIAVFQGGFGAVEVAARFEQIRFGSASKEGTPLLNPRADPLFGNTESIVTLGVNWYLNKWGRVLVNGMREAFEDPERTAVPGRTSGWAAVLRLQFVM